jgi:hypothetical protein
MVGCEGGVRRARIKTVQWRMAIALVLSPLIRLPVIALSVSSVGGRRGSPTLGWITTGAPDLDYAP